jgi:hypothetical protein
VDAAHDRIRGGSSRQAAPRSSDAGQADRPPLAPSAEALLVLQRSVGNAAVQRLVGGRGDVAKPAPTRSVAAQVPGTGFATAGAPLPDDVRGRMETALGGDFGGVHVHTDDDAAGQADALGASAFTIGRDVAFAGGAYRPGSPMGDALLAHELAHVTQQDATPERPALAARRQPPEGDHASEDEADRAATQAVLSLHAGHAGHATGSLPAERPSGLLSRIRTGLRLQRCTPKLGDAVGKARPQHVSWKGGHPLVASHGDSRVNSTWTPAATDHAVAYTKAATPTVDAQFAVGDFSTPYPGTTVSIRVTEGGAVRGTAAGITPAATVNVTGLALTGLSGSTEIRSASHTLQWEATIDGTTWTPVGTTGPHPIHWTHAAPRISPTPSIAVAKATGYAAGATAPADAAAKIRSGPRSTDGLAYKPDDPIDVDPLDVYTNKVGICTDYANLLSVLARAAGLNASTVMFWGGFESLGKLVWVNLGGSYQSLKEVKPGKPAFGMPGNPAGWDFTYHAIARVEGALHDAALDRAGYDAKAVQEGLVVHLIELAGGALPDTAPGVPFSKRVTRKDHPVTVTTHEFGPLLTVADFGLVMPLTVPAGTPSPVEVGGVTFTLAAGALPPGLHLDPATGIITGTVPKKSPKKTYTFTVKSSAGALNSSDTFSIKVG